MGRIAVLYPQKTEKKKRRKTEEKNLMPVGLIFFAQQNTFDIIQLFKGA